MTFPCFRVYVAQSMYPHLSDQKVRENVLSSLPQQTTFVSHLLEPKTASMTGRTVEISIVAAVAVNRTQLVLKIRRLVLVFGSRCIQHFVQQKAVAARVSRERFVKICLNLKELFPQVL